MSRIDIRYIEGAIGRMDTDETLEAAVEVMTAFMQNLGDEQAFALLDRVLTDDQKAKCAAAWGDE
jgi:hypothetical protein